MANERWAELHDATLESLELHWSSGEAVIRVRTSAGSRIVVASSVRRFVCDRQLPWGFSVSINEVRGPVAAGDTSSLLVIEMQSGDVLHIEAGEFSMRDAM